MILELSSNEIQMLERAARFVISDNIAELAWTEDEHKRKKLQAEARSYDILRKKLYSLIINTQYDETT